MKIGMVSPYAWDTPGGVQVHIRDLAKYYIKQGHEISVLAPVSDESRVTEDFVVPAGKPISVPYNGAVARVLFGPVAASRVRQWIAKNDFDVLHLHEPAIPSLSLLACWSAEGPLVGTFHAGASRQRVAFAIAPLLEPVIEKLSARIAVSEVARETLTLNLETDAVVIPNGINVATFAESSFNDDWRRPNTIGFIGRFDEPRKGLKVLLDALPTIVKTIPDVRIMIAGPGEGLEIVKEVPPNLRNKLTFLGRISEDDKAKLLKSVALYVAPNTGGESFGIILTEAMAAGTTVVASDIPAFSNVLSGGQYGALFSNENSLHLAGVITDLLSNPQRRTALGEMGKTAANRYDWSEVAEQIMDVYTMARTGNAHVTLSSETKPWNRLFT
jgi:phosphatidylinositol alpha-mannosyltransferase